MTAAKRKAMKRDLEIVNNALDESIRIATPQDTAALLHMVRVRLTRASFFANMLDGTIEDPTREWGKVEMLALIDGTVKALDEAIADVDKLLAAAKGKKGKKK